MDGRKDIISSRQCESVLLSSTEGASWADSCRWIEERITWACAPLIIGLLNFCYGDITQGIAFERGKDTIISENEWRIVLDINIREMYDEIETIETLYDSVYNQFTNLSSNPKLVWFRDIKFEVLKIRSSLDFYKNDLKMLLELLPHERTKRGLINVGGYSLKFLFGVATNDDLEETNQKVSQLQDIARSVVHSKEDQITLLKDVNKKIGLNSNAIVEVMNKLTMYGENVTLEFSALETHWSELFTSLYQYLHESNEIRELGQVVDEAKLRIVEFRHGLELVKSGRLSSKLFPPSDFLQVLSSIEKLIPVELRLIAATSVENMYLYYDVCSVQAVATWSSIRLLINVPLTSSAHQFETYKIHVIPLYHSNLKGWISWKLSKDYLLISNERQYYLPLTSVELSTCKDNLFYWCPNFVNLRHQSVNDCYYKLFMGKNTALTCPKVISTSIISPVFLRNGNDWIYSVDKPQKITIKCWVIKQNTKNAMSSSVISRDLEIRNSNVLQSVSNCEIYGDNFKIFSKIQGNIKFRCNITKLIVPSFESMLLPLEELAISNNISFTFETLNKLKENLNNDEVEIKIEKLIKQLDSGNQGKITVEYSFLYAFVVLLLCSVVLFVVVLCCRKHLWCSRRPGTEGSPATQITIQSGSALHDLVTTPTTSSKV